MANDQENTTRNLLDDRRDRAGRGRRFDWHIGRGAYRIDVAAVIGISLCAVSALFMGWLIWSRIDEIALGLGL